MPTKLNYVDRDAFLAAARAEQAEQEDAENEAEITSLSQQIAATKKQLAGAETNLYRLTDASLAAVRKTLGGRQTK